MLFNNKSVEELDIYYRSEIRFLNNCIKMQNACNLYDLKLTLLEIQEIYENYSDELCSSWSSAIEVLTDKQIFDIIDDGLIKLINDRINRWEEIKTNRGYNIGTIKE